MTKWLPVVVMFAVCTVGAAGYHVLKTIAVPGDYGWDYASADTASRRLYVGHDREVVVINLDTDALVGRVSGGADMHGATVATEFGRGFISESNPGALVIFDLKTLAKIAEVPRGRDPNLLLFDHTTCRE